MNDSTEFEIDRGKIDQRLVMKRIAFMIVV